MGSVMLRMKILRQGPQPGEGSPQVQEPHHLVEKVVFLTSGSCSDHKMEEHTRGARQSKRLHDTDTSRGQFSRGVCLAEDPH